MKRNNWYELPEQVATDLFRDKLPHVLDVIDGICMRLWILYSKMAMAKMTTLMSQDLQELDRGIRLLNKIKRRLIPFRATRAVNRISELIDEVRYGGVDWLRISFLFNTIDALIKTEVNAPPDVMDDILLDLEEAELAILPSKSRRKEIKPMLWTVIRFFVHFATQLFRIVGVIPHEYAPTLKENTERALSILNFLWNHFDSYINNMVNPYDFCNYAMNAERMIRDVDFTMKIIAKWSAAPIFNRMKININRILGWK